MNRDYSGQDASQDQEEDVPAPTAELHQPQAQNGASNEAEFSMETLLRDNEYAFRSLRRGETVEGTVVRVDQDEVLVDVGMKSEGVIPQREMYTEDEEAEPLHIGDRTLVYVVQPEGSEGHAILSLRRARLERSWREIEELYNQGAIVEAPVADYNKGGLIVDVKGVRGFVPVSQVLDLRNVNRQEGDNEQVNQTLAGMAGRRLSLKIIEINRSRNRLILSERAAVQEQRTQAKDQLMDELQLGQVRRGVVSNLTSFGAFVDLGGADGLVHVSELSYNRVNHPSEILRVGQQVDVAVLSVDRESKKIALSLKRALPDPWTTVEERYHLGEVVPAVITKLAKFGAFAKVEEGLEGLIHLSELTDLPVQDAAQVVQEDQHVNVKIIHINSQRRRLGLSVRQAEEGTGTVQSYDEVEPNTPMAGQDFGDYGPEATIDDEFALSAPEIALLSPDESTTATSTPEIDLVFAEEAGTETSQQQAGMLSAQDETTASSIPDVDVPSSEENTTATPPEANLPSVEDSPVASAPDETDLTPELANMVAEATESDVVVAAESHSDSPEASTSPDEVDEEPETVSTAPQHVVSE